MSLGNAAITGCIDCISMPQSRPQSASAHKRKGWHALQQGGAEQPSTAGRTNNTSTAVYVRPDRTVNANIPLGNSPSFPSLGNVASALPSHSSSQSSNASQPSKPNSWASPRPKHNSQQASKGQNSGYAKPSNAPQSSAALSPAKPKQSDSALSRGMAMSDSELADITSLLSTHPWAEPGLARVCRLCHHHVMHVRLSPSTCIITCSPWSKIVNLSTAFWTQSLCSGQVAHALDASFYMIDSLFACV